MVKRHVSKPASGGDPATVVDEQAILITLSGDLRTLKDETMRAIVRRVNAGEVVAKDKPASVLYSLGHDLVHGVHRVIRVVPVATHCSQCGAAVTANDGTPQHIDDNGNPLQSVNAHHTPVQPRASKVHFIGMNGAPLSQELHDRLSADDLYLILKSLAEPINVNYRETP